MVTGRRWSYGDDQLSTLRVELGLVRGVDREKLNVRAAPFS